MAGLLKEVWESEIKENPIPDTSFVYASTDKSEFVEANKLHLAEAGIEPEVHEDYFAGNEDDLPLQAITDIPNEVVLKTYSTSRTRHRKLQEIELQYDKRKSVINRHKTSLAKNLGKRAAFAWSPQTDNEFNRIVKLGANESIIDAIIDLAAFYREHELTENLNICLTPLHMAKIRKENVKLYKEILSGEKIFGFKPYEYSKNPWYTSAGAKKPYGSLKEAGDLQGSFTWCSDETFRCFGDTDMYETLASAASQADEVSFAQRALVGNIRANNPKFLGAILF